MVPTLKWQSVYVDKSSIFDRLPFTTEWAYTPVNYTIVFSFTLPFIKGVPQKEVTIEIFRLLPDEHLFYGHVKTIGLLVIF